MVALEEISGLLEHPLTLLLIGAGVSGVLVSWLTNRWQDSRRQREIELENRKKELEIKLDIVSRMSEAIGYQGANTAFKLYGMEVMSPDALRDALRENAKKWFIESYIIRTKLQTYFPESQINVTWTEYMHIVGSYVAATSLYLLKDLTEAEKMLLVYSLNAIKSAFILENKKIDWEHFTDMTYRPEDWLEVVTMLGLRTEQIVKDVLKLHITNL